MKKLRQRCRTAKGVGEHKNEKLLQEFLDGLMLGKNELIRLDVPSELQAKSIGEEYDTLAAVAPSTSLSTYFLLRILHI